jgi:hypothetical protein
LNLNLPFAMRSLSINLLFLLMLGLAACVSTRNAKLRLVGQWKETWGVGQKTDVDYQDVYVVALDAGGGLALTCPARQHYQFAALAQSGSQFSFTLEVRDDKYSTGPAQIRYQLKLRPDGRAMDGTATDAEGKKFNIRWDKQ